MLELYDMGVENSNVLGVRVPINVVTVMRNYHKRSKAVILGDC